jgi:ABC-2 type transport system ATP-binding protein
VDVGLRQALWQFIRRLNRDGHTIVLTTHYLEEAEQLCDRIAMLKAGKVVALDSTRNLLENFSGVVLKLRLDREALPDGLGAEVLASEAGRFTLRLRDFAALEDVLHRLREAGAAIRELELEPPDLEDVFLRVMEKH